MDKSYQCPRRLGYTKSSKCLTLGSYFKQKILTIAISPFHIEDTCIKRNHSSYNNANYKLSTFFLHICVRNMRSYSESMPTYINQVFFAPLRTDRGKMVRFRSIFIRRIFLSFLREQSRMRWPDTWPVYVTLDANTEDLGKHQWRRSLPRHICCMMPKSSSSLLSNHRNWITNITLMQTRLGSLSIDILKQRTKCVD